MVDRIRKILRQLLPKDLKRLQEVVQKVHDNDVIGLDVKKLEGRDDVYRVRKGDFRIIFQRVPGKENLIIAIERRSDTTYNEL
ncbi:MAG: type II toxin-antitoxin system RelE/ParE family toxin [Patescibacteria group bacterium]